MSDETNEPQSSQLPSVIDPFVAGAGYTTVSSTKLTDSSGNLVTNATIYFQPCDSLGHWLSYRVNGTGQAIWKAVSAQVTNGAFTVVLADTTLTAPTNICYLVTVVDNVSNQPLLGPGYYIQPSGSTWSFDTFVPNVGNLALIQNGPQGQGFIFRGAWTANTPYKPYDVFFQGSSSYCVITAYTSGASYGVTDPPNISLFAAGGTLTGTLSTPLVAPLGATITGGLTVDQIAIGGSSEQGLPVPNNLSVVWALVDQNLKLIFGVKQDGSLIARNLTMTGIERDSETMDLPVPNNLSIVWGLIDQYNQLILGVKSDGTVVSNGLTAQIAAQIAASAATNVVVYGKQSRTEVAEAGTYYTAVDGSSKTQIWRYDAELQTATQLTSAGNNTMPCPSEDGRYVTFLSDRSGPSTLMRMTRYGEDQVVATIDPAKLLTLSQVCGIGQSLCIGTHAQMPGITLTQPFDNKMFNTDTMCGTGVNGFSGSVPPANIASLQALTQTFVANQNSVLSENWSNGFADLAVSRLLALGLAHRILISLSAAGGTPYAPMAKGTTTYNNTIAEVTAAKTIATAQGYTHAVRAIVCVHGETDEANNNASYQANLQQWQSDYEKDIQAATGQTLSVPFIIDQLSSWTVFRSTTQSVIAPAQIAAWKAAPQKIIPACATYSIQHWTDGGHMDAESYRLMGQYFSKAYNAIVQGNLWRPVYPKWKRIAKIGKQITIPFFVPAPPLVFDTTLVTQPSFVAGSLYGFEVYDSGNNPIAISSAAITGKDLDTVVLTLATDPGNGASVAYAWTATIGAFAGPSTGPRGNLRDSSTETSYYPYRGQANYPLYNWCLHFKESIPNF